jgi:hypothetical protein
MGKIRRYFSCENADVQPLEGDFLADCADYGQDEGPAALPLTAAEKPDFLKLVREAAKYALED